MEAPRHPAAGRRSRGKSPYYIQPAKGGQFVVLHRPCGNRITPKVCGEMPSRAHAMALVKQLERAESAVDDLFLEATDDGIEALEAVLEACRVSVLTRELPRNLGQPRNRRPSGAVPAGDGPARDDRRPGKPKGRGRGRPRRSGGDRSGGGGGRSA
jgi:hypothetical protein